jgi:4-hydroxythreonine-4-phosphate dehydrogenase
LGLNPHAGEEGRFGDEEGRLIAPAIGSCKKKKIRARLSGPHSPDTVFYEALDGRYDAEICMYHDQGLIPLKMISRGHGVNITLGLPFVRTSPDHGTAYDIASRFVADAGSMRKALELASTLAKNRAAHA